MATIDMTHRKLNFPPRFLPYLEKHRIFELFHELVELLVQVKPKDHVRFLRDVLPCAAMRKDKQRIVFLSPKDFDRKNFSELLAECLGIPCIDLEYLEYLTRERKLADKVAIQEMSEEEEESCICPGEEAVEKPLRPMYFPSAEEEDQGQYAFFYSSTESVEGEQHFQYEEEEQEPEERPQPPCVCVCPCVKGEQSDSATGGKDGMEDGGGGGGGGEGDGDGKGGKGDASAGRDEWRGESYPSDWSRKTKKDKSKSGRAATTTTITTEESSVSIDYGILAECEFGAKGWILQDFPVTGEDAEKLNALGVIPTHALRIIVNEKEEASDREYRGIVHKWVNAYDKFIPVTEIALRGRNVVELSGDLCRLLSVMPHRHAPMLPRIALIGSRGSGVTTQGEKLARKYGMVHVEFELVIARALQQDDDLCRMYKTQLATRPDPELEALIIERALLTPACRNRGWVLTGYPRNTDQMRMLDIIATPPNRVIFLEVPPRECFVRLYYRKIDPCLGDEYKLPKIEPCGQDSYRTRGIEPDIADRLLSHPKNDKKQIISDIERYFLAKTDMMQYCGKTASYVDGDQTVDAVFELIEQVLINPAPAQPPRDPLAINHGIEESYKRLKKFRVASGMYFNNLLLNPPERVVRL